VTQLEQVILQLDGTFTYRGAYIIQVRSPSGTIFTPFRTRRDSGTLYTAYKTLINGFWGENPMYAFWKKWDEFC